MPPIEVLSHGFQKPTDPTYGDKFWPALESNIQQLNDHNHDGVTSAPLSAAITSVISDSWETVDSAASVYRQLITLPNNRAYDSTRIFVKRSTGEPAYPDLQKVSDTTFYIFTNDSSLAYDLTFL